MLKRSHTDQSATVSMCINNRWCRLHLLSRTSRKQEKIFLAPGLVILNSTMNPSVGSAWLRCKLQPCKRSFPFSWLYRSEMLSPWFTERGQIFKHFGPITRKERSRESQRSYCSNDFKESGVPQIFSHCDTDKFLMFPSIVLRKHWRIVLISFPLLQRNMVFLN